MYLTEKSLEKIKDELSNLKGRRREVAERIRIAREFGDLSENSEYEDARNEQSFVEGRIEELTDMVAKAKVVAKNGVNNNVEIGSIVTLQLAGQNVTYELVDPTESDPGSGKISVESPIGHSLIEKSKGDKVEIKTPGGMTSAQIIEVK